MAVTRASSLAAAIARTTPFGGRLAVFGNCPELGERAAGEIERAGLLLAHVTQHTDARMRLILPPGACMRQPMNTTQIASLAQMRTALETLADDPGVDAIVALIRPTFQLSSATIAHLLAFFSVRGGGAALVCGLPGRTYRGARQMAGEAGPARGPAAPPADWPEI